MSEFQGITMDMLFLLAENRFQDSKAFYEEHKPAIKAGVIQPLRDLVATLMPSLLAVDPLITGNVSRVRRDNRFTHDKSMYRENLWITLMRDKRAWDWCVPAFYLDFSLNHAEWGVGFYSATPAVMKALRAIADKDPKRVLAAIAAAEKAGFTLEGNPYAKPRSGPDTPDALRPLYDCRHVAMTRSEPPTMVGDPALPERLERGFMALVPFYTLLTEAMENALGVRQK